MKKSSKILIALAAALGAAFLVKSLIDRENYRISWSAPFELTISINALMLLLPAAVFCAAALFSQRKTGVMAAFAAGFAALAVWRFALQMSDKMGVSNSLLIASPYIAAAVVFMIFAAAGKLKRSGTILLIAGAVISAALAVLMIIVLFWFFAIPALVSAVVCVVFAIQNNKRGKE